MKKAAAILVVVVLAAAMASMVFAAEAKKGTIKSVDAKTGTIVFAVDGGSDMTLTADKSVDLGKVKAGDKVEIMVDAEQNTAKEIKAVKKKPAMGC